MKMNLKKFTINKFLTPVLGILGVTLGITLFAITPHPKNVPEMHPPLIEEVAFVARDITPVTITGDYDCTENCIEYFFEFKGQKVPDQVLFYSESGEPVAMFKNENFKLTQNRFPSDMVYRYVINMPSGTYTAIQEAEGYKVKRVVRHIDGTVPGTGTSLEPQNGQYQENKFAIDQRAIFKSPIIPKENTAVIKGRVQDPSGKPIANVRVSVDSNPSDKVLKEIFQVQDVTKIDSERLTRLIVNRVEVYTNEKGLYQIEVDMPKPESVVSLSFEKEGYQLLKGYHPNGGRSFGGALGAGLTYPDDYGNYVYSWGGQTLIPNDYSQPKPFFQKIQLKTFKLNPTSEGGISNRQDTKFSFIPTTCTFPEFIKVDINNDGIAEGDFNFKNYVKRVLFQEWVKGTDWFNTENVEEAYRAGAVAIQSFSMKYANTNKVIGNSQAYQVVDPTETMQSNSDLDLWIAQNLPGNHVMSRAVDYVWNWVVTRNGDFEKAEYARETNDGCESSNCSSPHFWGVGGDGRFQRSVHGPPCNSTFGAIFPLGNNYDAAAVLSGIYSGSPLCDDGRVDGLNSHPRAMSQRGTIRWATGHDVKPISPINGKGQSLNFPIQGSNGKTYTHKTWVELLSWYFPDFILENCANGKVIDLSCEDFSCSDPLGTDCGCSLDIINLPNAPCNEWFSVDVSNGIHRTSLYSGKSWHDWGPERVFSFTHNGGNLSIKQRNKSEGFQDVDVFVAQDLNLDGNLNFQTETLGQYSISDMYGTISSELEEIMFSYPSASSGEYFLIVETGSHGQKSGTTEIFIEAACSDQCDQSVPLPNSTLEGALEEFEAYRKNAPNEYPAIFDLKGIPQVSGSVDTVFYTGEFQPCQEDFYVVSPRTYTRGVSELKWVGANPGIIIERRFGQLVDGVWNPYWEVTHVRRDPTGATPLNQPLEFTLSIQISKGDPLEATGQCIGIGEPNDFLQQAELITDLPTDFGQANVQGVTYNLESCFDYEHGTRDYDFFRIEIDNPGTLEIERSGSDSEGNLGLLGDNEVEYLLYRPDGSLDGFYHNVGTRTFEIAEPGFIHIQVRSWVYPARGETQQYDLTLRWDGGDPIAPEPCAEIISEPFPFGPEWFPYTVLDRITRDRRQNLIDIPGCSQGQTTVDPSRWLASARLDTIIQTEEGINFQVRRRRNRRLDGYVRAYELLDDCTLRFINDQDTRCEPMRPKRVELSISPEQVFPGMPIIFAVMMDLDEYPRGQLQHRFRLIEPSSVIVDDPDPVISPFAVKSDLSMEPELIAYPNPANESFSLILDGIELNDASVRLFDLQGKLVKEVKKTRNISVVDLNSGIYLIQATTKKQKIYTAKLQKN